MLSTARAEEEEEEEEGKEMCQMFTKTDPENRSGHGIVGSTP